MKILYFHQHFTIPKVGGGIRSYEFSKKLIKRGHSVTMICGGSQAILNLHATKNKDIFRGNIEGIDIIQIALPYSNNDGKLKRASTFIKFALKSIKFALKEEYDLIFATTTPLTVGIPGLISKWFRNKTFVFEVRDFWPISTRSLFNALGKKYPQWLFWSLSFLGNRCYRNADSLIGLAPGINKALEVHSQRGKKISLIPNGCDLDIMVPGKRENLNIEGISSSDFVATFTGAHGTANGLNAVLDAASELKKRGRRDIKLLLIGEGMKKQELINRAKKENLDNVIFKSKVSKQELAKIIGSVDAGLQILVNAPFFYYGTSPNKFFDFISSGLPVLTNYPGWIADLIKENKCGVIAEPDSPTSFADQLIYLADHPEEKRNMGVNARKLAERDFNRENLGDKFVDFLEETYNAKK